MTTLELIKRLRSLTDDGKRNLDVVARNTKGVFADVTVVTTAISDQKADGSKVVTIDCLFENNT